MACYNFIKNNSKIFLKYFCFIITICSFIAFLLLVSCSNVSASSLDIPCSPSGQNIIDLPGFLYDSALAYFQNSSYSDYFIIRTDNHNSGADFWLILFNSESTDNFYVSTTDISNNGFYWLMSNRSNIPTVTYSLIGNSENNVSISQISTSLSFGQGSNKYQIRGIYKGSQSVYFNNGSNAPNYNHIFYKNFQEPVFTFENYDDTSVFQDSLVTGEFTYFYFKVQKKAERTPFPCGFYIHDLTNVSIPYDTYVNDTTSVFFDLNEYSGDYTAPNYLYKYMEDSEYIYYGVSCLFPFGSYNNNSTYQITLFVIDTTDNLDIRYEKNYTWTTSFSSNGIIKQEQNKNDQMLSNINYFRDFFDKNTQTANNSDFLKLFPSNSHYISPTDNGINTIFNAFYNAFTNTEPTSFSFEIPFSNGQTISVPSDLVTSRIPSSILYIIQAVYWYIICRFIVKDIAKIAQKAKSGEIFEDNTSNIKTDLL